jgi:mobilization protein NikA
MPATRNEVVGVRFTKTQKALLKRQAKAAGVSLSLLIATRAVEPKPEAADKRKEESQP